jgi:diaminopimelate epimerase
MATKVTKYHGLGNTYLFMNSADSDFPAPEFTKRVCDDGFGVGSDGLLYGGFSGPSSASRC